MGWGHLKIFFSRTTGPILTRLGTNHPLVKGIQICSKEGNNTFDTLLTSLFCIVTDFGMKRKVTERRPLVTVGDDVTEK
jgi:hypothetical protein